MTSSMFISNPMKESVYSVYNVPCASRSKITHEKNFHVPVTQLESPGIHNGQNGISSPQVPKVPHWHKNMGSPSIQQEKKMPHPDAQKDTMKISIDPPSAIDNLEKLHLDDQHGNELTTNERMLMNLFHQTEQGQALMKDIMNNMILHNEKLLEHSQCIMNKQMAKIKEYTKSATWLETAQKWMCFLLQSVNCVASVINMESHPCSGFIALCTTIASFFALFVFKNHSDIALGVNITLFVTQLFMIDKQKLHASHLFTTAQCALSFAQVWLSIATTYYRHQIDNLHMEATSHQITYQMTKQLSEKIKSSFSKIEQYVKDDHNVIISVIQTSIETNSRIVATRMSS